MFTVEQTDAFLLAAHIDPKRQTIYSTRRQPGIYAIVTIASCQHKEWWYAPFVGMEVFVELVFSHWDFGGIKRPYLYDIRTVVLTNTRKTIGRAFSPADIIIH
jgi:hypothetical protein